MHRHHDKHGFILLATMAFLAGVLTLTSVGMTRSMIELLAAQRAVDVMQAFHLAEGSLDDALKQLKTLTPAQINGLLSHTQTLTCELPGCGLSVSDNVAGSTQDTDGLIVVTAEGKSVGVTKVTQRILATVQVGNPGGQAFNYAVAGSTINLDGQARIGTAFDTVKDAAKLYMEDSPTGGTLITTASSKVYAGQLDFVNLANLPLYTGSPSLCPRCDDGSVFPLQPVDLLANLHAPKLPSIVIDLAPYYSEALREQTIDGNSYHHLTSDQTLQNVTLQGLIYIECGVNVVFKGTSTVNGTIVHEGCGGNINIGSNGRLTIDSTVSTPTFGVPFEPAIAILGQPDLGWGNTTTIDIKGFVMHNATRSVINTTGTIIGGVIAINAPSNSKMQNNPGPGGAGPIVWGPFSVAHLGGSTNVIFKPLAQNLLKGQPAASQAPKVRVWRQQPL